MSFRTRLMLIYTLLVFGLTLVLGLGFLAYATTSFESNARNIYSQLADRMISQFDNQFQLMDFYELNLISNEHVRSALDTMANLDQDRLSNQLDLEEARTTIKTALISYAAIKNFVATIVFNTKGDFFSSDFLGHASVTEVKRHISDLPWTNQAYLNPGHKYLLPPYQDPWNPDLRRQVFGLVRAMPGAHEDLGFLEVQGNAQILARIFEVPESGLRTIAWTAEGQMFYGSPQITSLEAETFRNWKGPEGVFTNFTGVTTQQMLFKRESDESGLYLVIAVDRAILNEPLGLTFLSALVVGLCVISFSIIFNWKAAFELTRPIRLIQNRIDLVGLPEVSVENLSDHYNDELVALNNSFERMRTRLDQAVKSEIRVRTMGLQAQLDSLQSQIDPHFVYNTLNMISAKGHELGSKKIPEICGAMARMLRYSTDTLDRVATLETEIQHVQTYLTIMKNRLEEDLEFQIALDPSLKNVAIPKVVLQPLIENSFRHGFKRVDRRVVIELHATVDNGRWCLEVLDNGQGFGASDLDKQRALLGEIETELKSGGAASIGWGGLGLKNTFARLWLFFGGDLVWSLDDRPQGGARISFGGPCV